jgi:VWFA-related protein
MITCLLALAWLASTSLWPALAQQSDPDNSAIDQPGTPIPSDLVERERTRLVIVDVVVLDGKDRTVPGLTLDDFELLVDRKPVEPDTLDVNCSESLEDARNVAWKEKRQAPSAVAGSKRRIVLAFDYLHLYEHLPQKSSLIRTEVLDNAMHMLENADLADDEVMIVALNGGLRVEQTFTADRREAWASLHRMQRDITLWGPSFEHTTEKGWTRGMTTLFDVLGTYPGTKAVVLFSAMDHLPLILEYEEVLAQAGASRSRVYTVDARGLDTSQRDITEPGDEWSLGSDGWSPGSSEAMVTDATTRTPEMRNSARLAIETGGRFTARTNDLSLGYARAQRDLTCVYSVGFYDEGKQDARHEVAIRVRRGGLQAIHPNRYTLRSEKERATSLLRAAWVAPKLFQTGIVRAHVFPLQPSSKRMWDALLAINFPVPLGASVHDIAVRDFGVVLSRRLPRSAETVEDKFDRRVTLRPRAEETGSTRAVTFLRRLRISPGQYRMTGVVMEPGESRPETVEVEFEVPEIPREDLFLVGPFLGRTAGPDLVVLGGHNAEGRPDQLGAANTFEPLLVQQINEPTDLVAITNACRINSKKARKQTPPRVLRSLTRAGGESAGALPMEALPLDGSERFHCRGLVDLLPAASLTNGEYLFEAELRGDSEYHGESNGVMFSVGTAEQELTDEADAR